MIGRLAERFASWESFLALMALALLAYAALAVPNFTSAFNLSQAAAGVSEKALLALPLTLLIIAREIDLSIASILALTSVILGVLVQAGMPLAAAIRRQHRHSKAQSARSDALTGQGGARSQPRQVDRQDLHRSQPRDDTPQPPLSGGYRSKGHSTTFASIAAGIWCEVCFTSPFATMLLEWSLTQFIQKPTRWGFCFSS